MAKRKKKKKIKIRSLLAIDAWFRTSAGPIKDKKKEKSLKECRNWKKGSKNDSRE